MGKYTLLARIGNGGMADVFLAVARGPMGFNKLSVVKRMRHSEETASVEMFMDEARLAARLNHPNIVHTYEVGETGGRYFIAMEYLEGQSLHHLRSRLIERGTGLSEPLVALIASRALKGLHSAHELTDFDGSAIGIVHRDVSPHNLFVTYAGEIKLIDFGIAKARVNSTHTETGVLKGKVRYMAPEQVAGKDVDRRVDIFAFGVVLWELLARRQLFSGEPLSVLTRIVNETAPSARSARPEVSPEFDAIVERALRPKPEDRYPTADAMRVEVDRLLRGHDTAQLEEELGRLMNDVFAETRDAVRARIKSFLSNMEALPHDFEGTDSQLMKSEELPALLSDSGASAGPRATGETNLAGARTSSGTTPRPVTDRSRTWPLLVVVAVVGIAATVGMWTLRKGAAPPAQAAPASTTARVHLETVPAGALVEWRGHPLDRTPADLVLDPGTQKLMVTRDGFEPESLSVEVKAGDSLTESLTLRPKAVPPPASASAVAAAPPPASPPPSRPSGRSSRGAPAGPAPTAAPPATPTPSATARPKIQVLDDESQ